MADDTEDHTDTEESPDAETDGLPPRPATKIVREVEQRPLIVALITFPSLLVIASPLGYITGVFSVIVLGTSFGSYAVMPIVIGVVVLLFALLGTYTAFSNSRRLASQSSGQ